jgi:sarcosine oxidase subunit alpha
MSQTLTYEQVNAHCDCWLRRRSAGLMAALVAGRAGLRVILAEQDLQFGGALLWELIQLDGQPAAQWLGATLAELETLPNVLLLRRTTVSGCYDHKVCTLLQQGDGHGWRECFWTVRPKRIVLATGLSSRAWSAQRPPGHHAGRGDPPLPQSLRRRCRTPGPDCLQ